MTYQLRFGGYDIPNTITINRIGSDRRVPASRTPRYDGGRTLAGMLDIKKFSLRGGIYRPIGDTADTDPLRTKLDALKAALAVNQADFTTDSDRFYRLCQVEGYADDYEPTGFNRMVNLSFEIVTGDPYSYEVEAQTSENAVSSSPTSVVVDNEGGAPAAPQISLTVGGSGAIVLDATLTNETTGEVCTLYGNVTGGDIIAIDSLLQTVKTGSADKMTLFDGLFPSLAVGENTLTIEWTSGSITQMDFSFHHRWF